MSFGDVMIIVIAVVVVVGAGLYFLNRWASKKSVEQQSVIEKAKQQTSIYVIDKKRDKAENVNLPKSVLENLPKMAKAMKLYFVKAKVGPQITTLMCEKNIFNMIEPKKTYKVEVAGMYIVSLKGMKSAEELKEQAKLRKQREKEDKKKEDKKKASAEVKKS